jgi:hypothetical protein
MVEDDETADYEIDDKLQYYAQLKKNRGMSGTNSRKFPKSKFYPTAALQCHAENVKSEDVQVWAIAFEFRVQILSLLSTKTVTEIRSKTTHFLTYLNLF